MLIIQKYLRMIMSKRPVLNVVDLFSGLEGWSQAWRDRGHNVFRVEINDKWPAEHRDVLTLTKELLPWKPDVVLASPPCTSFSMMSIGTHWTHDNQPKTPTAEMGIRLVRKTLEFIKESKPKFYLVENPRAKLRKMAEMNQPALVRSTVTYCRYGERRMKPTDLWGRMPIGFKFRDMCHNGNPDHEAAPRGSRTGTQGMSSADSAKIPYELAKEVCIACEEAISRGEACNIWPN
jgi:hypothetical protein